MSEVSKRAVARRHERTKSSTDFGTSSVLKAAPSIAIDVSPIPTIMLSFAFVAVLRTSGYGA